jgi:hypothetical protein
VEVLLEAVQFEGEMLLEEEVEGVVDVLEVFVDIFLFFLHNLNLTVHQRSYRSSSSSLGFLSSYLR